MYWVCRTNWREETSQIPLLNALIWQCVLELAKEFFAKWFSRYKIIQYRCFRNNLFMSIFFKIYTKKRYHGEILFWKNCPNLLQYFSVKVFLLLKYYPELKSTEILFTQWKGKNKGYTFWLHPKNMYSYIWISACIVYFPGKNRKRYYMPFKNDIILVSKKYIIPEMYTCTVILYTSKFHITFQIRSQEAIYSVKEKVNIRKRKWARHFPVLLSLI